MNPSRVDVNDVSDEIDLSESTFSFVGDQTQEDNINYPMEHIQTSQNAEGLSLEVAYATELSGLEMVTFVTTCDFVLPDF